MSDIDPAKARFVILAVLRFGGVLMAMVGVSILMKRWIEPADIIGTALLAFGVIEVVVVPMILARAWSSTRKP